MLNMGFLAPGNPISRSSTLLSPFTGLMIAAEGADTVEIGQGKSCGADDRHHPVLERDRDVAENRVGLGEIHDRLGSRGLQDFSEIIAQIDLSGESQTRISLDRVDNRAPHASPRAGDDDRHRRCRSSRTHFFFVPFFFGFAFGPTVAMA